MLETWLRRKGLRDGVDITYSTYEESFIQAFGPRLHEVVVQEFAERRIAGHTDEVVARVTEDEVVYTGAPPREFDFANFVSSIRVRSLVPGAASRRPRLLAHRTRDQAGRSIPRRLRSRRRRGLPRQAGVSRLPAGRCGRRPHRFEHGRKAVPTSLRSDQHVRHGDVRHRHLRSVAAGR